MLKIVLSTPLEVTHDAMSFGFTRPDFVKDPNKSWDFLFLTTDSASKITEVIEYIDELTSLETDFLLALCLPKRDLSKHVHSILMTAFGRDPSISIGYEKSVQGAQGLFVRLVPPKEAQLVRNGLGFSN